MNDLATGILLGGFVWLPLGLLVGSVMVQVAFRGRR